MADDALVSGGAPVVIHVLANDIGTGLRVTAVGQPSHGTATITDVDQSITYTPQSGYVGPDSFTYTATDATNQTATATVNVNVLIPSIAIVGNPWSAITVTPVTIPVLDNDVGVGLEVVAVTDPPHGTATISGTSLNAAMPKVITKGNNRLAVAFVAASADMDLPAATGGTGGTWAEQHQRRSGVGDDSVVNMQTAAMASGGIISGANTVLPLAAKWVVRAFALVPKTAGTTPSYTGFTAGAGTEPSQATSPITPSYPALIAGDLIVLHVVVRAVNGAVTTPTGFTLLWGPDDASNRTVRSWVFGRIAAGTETGTISVAFTGTTTGINCTANTYGFRNAQAALTFEGTGVTSGGGGPTVTYTADASFTGADSFTYTAQDDYGQQGTATVSVNVLASAPTVLAVADNAAATAGVAKTISPLANDRPTTGTINSVTAPSSGTATIITPANKQVLYTAPATFTGNATFNYTMNDGGANTSTATVTVAVSAATPAAVDDQLTAVTAVTKDLDVLANDIGAANLTITAVGATNHGGTAAAKTPDNKLITYTSAAGYTGPEVFQYTANDGLNHPSVATVTVTVSSANIQAFADSYNATAGVMRTLTPLDNDTPSSGIHISTVGTSLSGATITKISGPLGADTQLNYTAPASFSGHDEFSYTITDVSNNLSTNTISITVSQIAFTPTADAVTTPQDTPTVLFSPLGNDGGTNTQMVAIGATTWTQTTVVLNDDTVVTGPVVANNDGPGVDWRATAGVAKELSVLANDTPQSASLIVKSGSITGFNHGGQGVRTVDNKRILYTAASFTGTETFTYVATDGTNDSSPATVSMDVSMAGASVLANPDPGVGNPAIIATVGVQLAISPLVNDSPASGLRVSAVTNPTQRGHAVISGSGTQVLYTADSAGSDTFNYTCTDESTTSTSSITLTAQTATVAVTGVNDSFTNIVQGTPTLLSVLANDTPSTAALSIKAGSIGTFSNGGSGSISGTQVLYTAAANFVGTETFNYIVTDGVTEDPATVSVGVIASTATGPFATITPTIGLTRTGSKLIVPTTAQLKNIQTGNADAAVQGLNFTTHQNNDNCTIDLRNRKFYHHSAVRWTGDNNQPRKKSPISLTGGTIRSGLSIFGGEFIGEQADTAPWAEMQYNAASGLDLQANDNAIAFSQVTATNATFYVENCILRKNFDGINTVGASTATNKNKLIVRECYTERLRNKFIQNDAIQLLEVAGCLIDSCSIFLSIRSPGGITSPDYSVVANRVKMRTVLARLRGQFITGSGASGAIQTFSKRTAQWADDNSTVTTWTTSQTTNGYGHREPFRGQTLNTNSDFGADPWVDAQDCIFAFEGGGMFSGPVLMPPGTYVNCYLCFLPDQTAVATNPSRNDFLDPTWGPRSGLTVLWGSEARDTWFDARNDWINARHGFTNTDGLQDFPFAHT